MYLKHFGLNEAPFSIAPDPRYLFPGRRHQEALAHLIFGLNGEGGIVLLTGEVGTGKTTVSRKLLEDIPAHTDIAWIVNPRLSVCELLATICDELHIRYPENTQSIKCFTDLISRHLLDAHARGRNTVLMIDEAQNLSPDVLEQLRLLTNLETNERKLLQIVLLGQDELKEMLERRDLRQLAQRITARYHLEPLDRTETAAYIAHRLTVAGAKRPLFRRAALRQVHRLSRGIPRLINLLCDRALLGAYAGDRPVVDAGHVNQAAREVLGHAPRQRRPLWLGAALAGFALFWLIQPPVSRQDMKTVPMPAAPVANAPETADAATSTSAPDDASETPADSDAWAVLGSAGDAHLAWQTLLRLWQPQASLPDNGDPCPAAAGLGLQCLKQQGGWGMLRRLNRPAVIRLDTGNRDTQAVLVSLTADTATLQLGERQWRVPLDELEKHWFSEFTIFWRSPPGYRDTLRPGHRGKAVAWLAEQMDRVQGQLIPPHRGDRMDAVLVSRIRDFQRSRGLNPDGAAGPLTLMQLNDALRLPRPHLQGGQD